MVGKLLKYDLRDYFRVLVPAYVTMFAIALFCRIVQFFEPALGTPDAAPSMTIYHAVFVSSVVLLVLAGLVVLVLTFIQVILVFYRNLFTRVGYLSFTLPVSTDQHLGAKISGALIANAASVLAVVVAAGVAMLGEMLVEVVRAGAYLVGMLRDEFLEQFGAGHFGLFVTEGVIAVIVSCILSILFCYLCIALGQRAKKNRVLAAFGIFFGFYVLAQILATVLVIVVGFETQFMDDLAVWFLRSLPGSLHLVMWIGIVVCAALSAAAYAITRSSITRHLNLE